MTKLAIIGNEEMFLGRNVTRGTVRNGAVPRRLGPRIHNVTSHAALLGVARNASFAVDIRADGMSRPLPE